MVEKRENRNRKPNDWISFFMIKRGFRKSGEQLQFVNKFENSRVDTNVTTFFSRKSFVLLLISGNKNNSLKLSRVFKRQLSGKIVVQ